MRIFGRVAYAIFMVILFWFMYDYAIASMTNQYIEKYTNQALEQEPIDYDFFASTVPGYRHDDTLFIYENDDYAISFHEIVLTEMIDDELILTQYVYIIAQKFEGSFDSSTKFQMTFQTANEEITAHERLLMFPFRQFGNLMNVLFEEGVYIPRSKLSNPLIESFELVVGEQVLLSFDHPTFDFTLRNLIRTHYENNETLDAEALSEIGVITYVPHKVSEFMTTFWIALAVYVVILIIFTYFAFFFKKRFMGKQKPTEGLQKHKATLKD